MRMITATTVTASPLAVLTLFIVLFGVPASAQPTPPNLKVVQPYYDTPLAMHLEWTTVINAQDYQIRRKKDAGAWGDWQSVGVTTSHTDNNSIVKTSTFTYEVRVKVAGVWSASSNARGNQAIKIWPVTKTGNCTDAESLELLHGINQPIKAGGNHYLHEGLDLQGEEGTEGECVRAGLGGVFDQVGGPANNRGVWFKVHLNGNDEWLHYNHLVNVPASLTSGESFRPDAEMGKITSTFWAAKNNHTHFHYTSSPLNLATKTKNPFLVFDATDNAHRDPRGVTPQVENTDGAAAPGNPDALRFRIGPDETDYLPTNDTIYNAVDIVVEATDHQSADAPWEVPRDIGYYIQRVEGTTITDVVRSAASPYLLVNGTQWLGTMIGNETEARMNTLRDGNANWESIPPATPAWYVWDQWFTYIVTNTKGTDGSTGKLDADQCWATDARSSETSVNGYKAGYNEARANDEAKFPDGKHRVRIRLADFVNATNATTDYSHDVLVDNFRPYVKSVSIKSGRDVVYLATWNWNGTTAKLALSPSDPDDGITRKASPAKDVVIVVTTSEPMKELSISAIEPLGWAPTTHESVNGKKTEWTFRVPKAQIPDDGSKDGTHVISISGKDNSNNALEGYTKTKTSYAATEIPRRQANGAWSPAPTSGSDTIHRFEVGVECKTPNPEQAPKAKLTRRVK